MQGVRLRGMLQIGALLHIIQIASAQSVKPDPRGYILYCPCMGRFGNQADQFLGALNFAKLLDRTLVLPHWVEYPPSHFGSSLQVPFDTYFKVEPLLQYHRVMLMNDFMKDLAPVIWPAGNRTVFCYAARNSYSQTPSVEESCHAKEGNPFGPFWDKFSVDFDYSEFYGPLYFSARDAPKWGQRYPASKWPVITFTGAPGAFPVSLENSLLHKYLIWSDFIQNQATAVIDKRLTRPFIGAHLRIGSDWENACRHVKEGQPHHLFASPQCLGQSFEYGTLTKDMCLPSMEIVINQLVEAVKKFKAKAVFLARDDKKYDKRITSTLKDLSVGVFWLEEDNPHLDLAILAQSTHYVGNCVSTFSSFVTRERKAFDLKSSFWGFLPNSKEEL